MQEFDPETVQLCDITVNHTILPEGMRVLREVAHGANNRVFHVLWGNDIQCVLRAPRRRSDTQQRGNAIWEFRHTLRAAALNVGPKVLTAWYARHAMEGWTSGLYLVMERCDDDLDSYICRGNVNELMKSHDLWTSSIVNALSRLADEQLFVYDLKPGNVVTTFDGTIKIIDYGKDFSEWNGNVLGTKDIPVIEMIRHTILHETGTCDDVHVSHILFACMMIILSATTTHLIYDERRHHRMNAATRSGIHPVVTTTCALLDSMQGRNVAIVRRVLRTDSVRGVLRHYLGRRNSGTRRVCQIARGIFPVSQ